MKKLHLLKSLAGFPIKSLNVYKGYIQALVLLMGLSSQYSCESLIRSS